MFQQPSGIQIFSYIRGVETSPTEVKKCVQGQSIKCCNLGLELKLPKDALTTSPHVFLCCGLTVLQAVCFPAWALNRGACRNAQQTIGSRLEDLQWLCDSPKHLAKHSQLWRPFCGISPFLRLNLNVGITGEIQMIDYFKFCLLKLERNLFFFGEKDDGVVEIE